MKLDEFMGKCSACGGNWAAMIISGIKAVAPDVYKEMPDRTYSFDEVCFIANHLCEDRPHLRYNLSMEGNIIEFAPCGGFRYRRATEEEMNIGWRDFDRIYNGVTEEETEKKA